VIFADDDRDDEKLFGVMHVRDDEEEVPNAKRMCVREEEVSLS
jgi:hypothetical protein